MQISTEEIKNMVNDLDLNKTKASLPIKWVQEIGSVDFPGGVCGKKKEKIPKARDKNMATWKIVTLSPQPYHPTIFTITIQAIVPKTLIGGNSTSGLFICLMAMEVVKEIAGVKVRQ
jgi:hypothetical protein